MTIPLFILGMALLIAAFDLFVWQKQGVEQTISRVIGRWAVSFRILPHLLVFWMGALFGHFFL
jgi:hypothetical protein